MDVLHGLALLCILLVIPAKPANAMLSGTHPKPHKLVAISNCSELKRALEQTWPPTDVLITQDIFCSSKIWGAPVVIRTARAIIGIKPQPHALPSIDFTDVREGIVVADTGKLTFETLSLVSTLPQNSSPQIASGGTQPPPVLKVEWNGTVDFVGVWMCCQDCMREQGPTQVYFDQLPTHLEDSTPITLGVDTTGIEALEVGDISPGDTQSETAYVKWLEGDFTSGGSYHMCATTVSCKIGGPTHSAFMYFADNSIEMCRSNPTVVILSQDSEKGSDVPMLVAVLVISISTAVCVVMVVMVVVLVKTRHRKKGRSRGIQGSASPPASIRNMESNVEINENVCEIGVGQRRVDESDDDIVEMSGTTLSFNGVEVDLTKLLGRGGFSTVYEGTYQGRVVAVKIVEHTQRLRVQATGQLAEVKLHEHLSHPYIVMTYCSKVVPIDAVCLNSSLRSSPTISVGPEGSSSNGEGPKNHSPQQENSSQDQGEAMCTLIVMEYCEKGNLFEAIHKGEFFQSGLKGVPDLAVILRSALDVASAMRYLHAKGIVHGDLKPENVLMKALAEDDRGYICKISDFGLSRNIPINTFLQTATLGTITHMPPELLRDGILGPAADVYSFGIMLWEMLSGNIPFKGQGHHDIVLGVVEGNRPAVPSNVPRGMSELIEDCWRENHLQRPTFVHVIGRLQGIIYDVQRHVSAAMSRHLMVASPCESYEPPPTEDWRESCSKSVLSSTTPTNTPRHSSTSLSSGGSPVIWDCVNSLPSSSPKEETIGEPSGQLWCASVYGMDPLEGVHLRTQGSEMNFMEIPWKSWEGSGKLTTASDSCEQRRGVCDKEQGRDAVRNPRSQWQNLDQMEESPSIGHTSGKINPIVFPEHTDQTDSFGHMLKEMPGSNFGKGPRKWDDVVPTHLNSCLEIDWDAVHSRDPGWNPVHFSPNDFTSVVTTISAYEVDSQPIDKVARGSCLECKAGCVEGDKNKKGWCGSEKGLHNAPNDSPPV